MDINHSANEGGFFRGTRPSTATAFYGNLRQYPVIKIPGPQDTPDYFGWAQRSQIRSYKELESVTSRNDTIKKMVDRLSQPKNPRYRPVKATNDFRISTSRSVALNKIGSLTYRPEL